MTPLRAEELGYKTSTGPLQPQSFSELQDIGTQYLGFSWPSKHNSSLKISTQWPL